MRSRGSVVLKRIPRTPTVSILPGERVFHKLPDGTYEPATITLEAVVNNVDNPKYQWGRIVGGSFQPYSVVLSHMIASPVHAGVVAVKVTGDNVPNAIIASETLTIVEDGISPVQYRIVVKQLDRIVTSISCDANGNPKLYYQATAYLYKITGDIEELCEDFNCVVVYYKNGTQTDTSISTSPSGSYVFDVSGDYDLIRVGFVDLESSKDIIETSLAKVYDGAPAVQYSIEILQNGKSVSTIACDAEGYPKLEPTAIARLYKKVGNADRTLCSDFYCKVASMNTEDDISNEEESGVPVSDYEFEVTDNYYNSFAVSFFDKESKKTVAEHSISRTYDGSTGANGYTYRSRGMFTSGETYIWNSEYRDIVFSWFNEKLYAFRVKKKGTSVTVPPTASNGDDNWDVANDLKFVATDLLLAQNAVVDVLGTSKIYIGNLDKTEGWEMTKGAIKHTGTGLELTKDGKLSAPSGGITIGTKSVEGMIDDIHIGGRNYAHGTSDEWSESVTLEGSTNQTFSLYDCYLTDVKAGDVVCFSFSLEYSNIVKNSNPIFQLQAPGSDTGWDNGGMGANILPFVQAGSGTVRVVAFYTVTEYQLNNKYWPVGIRCDNMTGNVRYKSFKFEIGTKPTGWSLAPEDYVETGIDIQNRKIILQADTTEFRNNAGELIAIFQGDKIKASLIDVDNLVAKKVETSNSGKRFVIDPDSNSMEVFDANNNRVISISFKDINDPNVDLLYPSIVCYQYINGIARNSASINGNNVQVLSYDTNGNAVYNATFSASGYYVSNGNSGNHSILSYDGLRIYKNGTLYKSYT